MPTGPALLEVRVASDAHTDAGRPTTTPAENKAAFMRALDRDGGLTAGISTVQSASCSAPERLSARMSS